MGWPDANQPFEDSLAQRCSPISYILEFFAVACIANVGKVAKKAVNYTGSAACESRSHKLLTMNTPRIDGEAPSGRLLEAPHRLG